MIPQRKKTPEEIAKLREELGLAGPVPPVGPPAPQEAVSVSAPPPTAPAPPPVQAAPAPPPRPMPAPEPVVSLTPVPAPEIQIPPAPAPATSEPKPVRSLRRSERIPAAAPQPAARISQSSALPSRRHSDDELNRIRRGQMIQSQQTQPGNYLIALTAHPAIVGLGYFCIFVAAILPVADHLWLSIPVIPSAILCGGAFAIAAFIFLKKKRSLHHAGFIASIAFFIVVFGALYYFPQLRNAP